MERGSSGVQEVEQVSHINWRDGLVGNAKSKLRSGYSFAVLQQQARASWIFNQSIHRGCPKRVMGCSVSPLSSFVGKKGKKRYFFPFNQIVYFRLASEAGRFLCSLKQARPKPHAASLLVITAPLLDASKRTQNRQLRRQT